jgi:hypothetical protein
MRRLSHPFKPSFENFQPRLQPLQFSVHRRDGIDGRRCGGLRRGSLRRRPRPFVRSMRDSPSG